MKTITTTILALDCQGACDIVEPVSSIGDLG